MGALIEVGTGLHPELSGRENVHLFGSILGLTRQDIRKRFDAIVDFAGVGSAIDQPVKQFSSGMQLRLGFAVAAHLEPDVLIVDEAIAVGDAGFQHRCVERMAELVRQGRTLVFVSHNLSAVETLCKRAVLLHNGKVAVDGPARDVIQQYLQRINDQSIAERGTTQIHGDQLDIERVSLLDTEGRSLTRVTSGNPLRVRLEYNAKVRIERPIFSIGIGHGLGGLLAQATMLVDGQMPEEIADRGYIDCVFEALPLQAQTYELWGSVRGSHGFGDLVTWQSLRLFEVEDEIGPGPSAVSHSMADAPVKLPYRWEYSPRTEMRGV